MGRGFINILAAGLLLGGFAYVSAHWAAYVPAKPPLKLQDRLP